MDVLLISDGQVENCICADSVERAVLFYPQHTCIERTEELQHVGPGFAFDLATSRFTAPPAPPPERLAPLSRVDFMRRFTDTERLAVRAASKTDPIVEDAMDLLQGADQVHLDDADVVRFVGYLAQAGLIDGGRVSAILGG